MKKSQLEHVLRAARKICGDDEFIVIGSQSLHGKYPDLADELTVSYEADLISKNQAHRTEYLNAIGIDSEFHETYGYYADPVDFDTATLPKKWKNRLVNLKAETDLEGARAYCLEPHDLLVAKLAAGREKDKLFIKGLIDRKLLDPETIIRRIAETSIDSPKKALMQNLFNRLLMP